MRRSMMALWVALALAFFANSGVAQLQVVPLSDLLNGTEDLAAAVFPGELFPIGDQTPGIWFNGEWGDEETPSSAGTFSGGGDIIGLESGMILSTGAVMDALGTNGDRDTTGACGGLPDNLLQNHLDELKPGAGYTVEESTNIAFEFRMPQGCDSGVLMISYVFASEEYNEYVNSDFNDVFGFFLDSGGEELEQMAVLPDGNPISVNSINGGNPLGQNASHPELYFNNDYDPPPGYVPPPVYEPPFNIEYDGFTVPLTACLAFELENPLMTTPAVVFAIGDVGDTLLDSAVFIESVTFAYQGCTATSDQNGDWATGSTWFGNAVPESHCHVVIAEDTEVFFPDSEGLTIPTYDPQGYSLTIESGGVLHTTSSQLTVTEHVFVDGELDGYVVSLGGNMTVTGTGTVNGGFQVRDFEVGLGATVDVTHPSYVARSIRGTNDVFGELTITDTIMTVGGHANINDGRLQLDGGLFVGGNVDFSGEAEVDVNSAHQLHVGTGTAGGDLTVSGVSTLDVYGVVELENGDFFLQGDLQGGGSCVTVHEGGQILLQDGGNVSVTQVTALDIYGRLDVLEGDLLMQGDAEGDGNRVTVQEGGQVSVDGNVLVNDQPGVSCTLHVSGTLSVDHDMMVALGAPATLAVDPLGDVDVAGNFEFGDDAEYHCQIGDSTIGLLTCDGEAGLAGTLSLEAVAKLHGPSGDPLVEWYGDETRTIISGPLAEDTVTELPYPFSQEPLTGPGAQGHLGYGVFLTEDGANSQGVTYNSNSVEVDLFQAADGDTNGNRNVDSGDTEAILAGGKFGTGQPATWPEGDFTGDGLCDGADMEAMLATGLFGTGAYAAMDPGVIVAHEQLDLILTEKGLVIDTHGTVINGYRLESGQGVLTGDPANNLGLFQEDLDSRISGHAFFELAGRHLLGDVIGEAFADVDLVDDLTFTYTIEGAAGAYFAKIVVPEPHVLAIFLSGLLTLVLFRKFR